MPKTFQFNHNDYVSVTLTKTGAEHLSKLHKDLYTSFPKFKGYRKDVFTEGEVYRTQFWNLIIEFSELMQLGIASPFELGNITVESSLEN